MAAPSSRTPQVLAPRDCHFIPLHFSHHLPAANTMCFYNQDVWTCRHWQWRQRLHPCAQAQHQRRPCRLKLILTARFHQAPCPVCHAVHENERVLRATESYIHRRSRRPSTLARARWQADQLRSIIDQLERRFSGENLIVPTAMPAAMPTADRPSLAAAGLRTAVQRQAPRPSGGLPWIQHGTLVAVVAGLLLLVGARSTGTTLVVRVGATWVP